MAISAPFVDEHAVVVHASRATVWAALEEFAARSLTGHRPDVLRRALGTHPPSGYGMASKSRETRLELTGRHRFATYWLVFDLADAGTDTTRLSALTYAEFPGPSGRAYRTLVIGSKMHVLAVRRMLDAIRDRAEDSERS